MILDRFAVSRCHCSWSCALTALICRPLQLHCSATINSPAPIRRRLRSTATRRASADDHLGGGDEVLHDDAVRMADRMRAAGSGEARNLAPHVAWPASACRRSTGGGAARDPGRFMTERLLYSRAAWSIGADDHRGCRDAPDRGNGAPAEQQRAAEYNRALAERKQPSAEEGILQPHDKNVVYQIDPVGVALEYIQHRNSRPGKPQDERQHRKAAAEAGKNEAETVEDLQPQR